MPAFKSPVFRRAAVIARFFLAVATPSCVSTATAQPRPISSTCEDLASFRERFDDDPHGAPCSLEDPQRTEQGRFAHGDSIGRP